MCEQYIRERCTGNCAGTELVRYRWLYLMDLSYTVYVAFFTIAYIYFSYYFLSSFSPPALSCCVLASGTIPWAILHSPRTAVLILFTLPSILLLYLFFPTRQQSQFQKMVYIFCFKVHRHIRPDNTYVQVEQTPTSVKKVDVWTINIPCWYHWSSTQVWTFPLLRMEKAFKFKKVTGRETHN